MMDRLKFYIDWHEIIKKNNLSMEQYGAIVFAMCEFCFYGIDTRLEDPLSDTIFQLSKPIIQKDIEYKIRGQKGGIGMKLRKESRKKIVVDQK